MKKEFLKKLIKKYEKQEKELRKKIADSESANEVRELGKTLDSVLEELEEAKTALAEAEKEQDNSDDSANGDDGDTDSNAGTESASRSGFNPSFARGANFKMNQSPEKRTGNALDSMEYRKAFAKYVQTGEWDYQKRDDEILTTSDVGKIIPNTIMTEFIRELKVYGVLYDRVRKLNIKGGVEFPIEELVPTVSWISETTVSDTQRAPELKTSVSFNYYIVEARIAQSLLSQVVALDVLETEIARLLAEAFVKEFDRIILSGTGSGQPLGILNDARVKAANKLTFTSAEMADWTKWRTKFFAKIPLAYRGEGVLVMTAATWESYIMTLKDANDRPLYSETYDPTNGNQICRFAGREVILVEPDIIKDYDTAATGEAWAIYFKPDNYAINSNLQLGFKRWFDDDKNRWVNKGLCIMDGKLLDTNGVFIFNKSDK
jgi:HK97 family phage major capsid protein